MLDSTKNLIVFDISADFAHFKRPYTTTSPVTFPFPSKPTLYGMISAIIGLDKNDYLQYFFNQGIEIGLKIINPIHKIYIAENLINTKDDMARFKTHTQIKIEFLKNPAYRIYVNLPDENMSEKLLKHLTDHTSVYTFSMGLSECLSNFNLVGNFTSITRETSAADYSKINSIIPNTSLSNDESSIKFTEGAEIFRISLTAEMNPQREIQKMLDMIYERTGKPILAKVKSFAEIQELEENIILF